MVNTFGLAVNTHGCYGQGSRSHHFRQDIISERSVEIPHVLVVNRVSIEGLPHLAGDGNTGIPPVYSQLL